MTPHFRVSPGEHEPGGGEKSAPTEASPEPAVLGSPPSPAQAAGRTSATPPSPMVPASFAHGKPLAEERLMRTGYLSWRRLRQRSSLHQNRARRKRLTPGCTAWMTPERRPEPRRQSTRRARRTPHRRRDLGLVSKIRP